MAMAKIPYIKPHFSYAAQLALLKSRGMQFADETKALHLLEKIAQRKQQTKITNLKR